MKFNKWTLGLAAIGVVSLASAAQAEEKMSAVQSAMSSTTISGYVDTSAHWNLGTGNAVVAPYKFNNLNKADGFNLNVVQLTIAKPLDEADWAAGYRADLWFGPDANVLGTVSDPFGFNDGDFAIRQAYVALRMPIGNGLDWKVGVFDSIIGYESVESGNNPNYTRSYGHSIEPQTHTGLLATYRFNDVVSVAAGIANTVGPTINERAFDQNRFGRTMAESYKTYMGSIALTAPDSWGWAAGSTLYGGVVNGFNGRLEGSTTSWYAGATLATPVTGLKVGAAFDYLNVNSTSTLFYPRLKSHTWAVGGYASYQATEKLSLHVRGEYIEDKTDALGYDEVSDGNFGNRDNAAKIFALTGTIQYDLWKNVISRLEVRWDHSTSGDRIFGGQSDGDGGYTGLKQDAVLLAANIIYKF